MADISSTSKPRRSSPLVIHFDVPGHQIPLSIFITTAQQADAIVRSLSQSLFDGQLRYQVLVLPPEEGTFLSRLGIVLLAGWGAIWTFTESDIGKAFIKGLTNEEPAYWAEAAGREVREAILSEDEDPKAVKNAVQCEFGEKLIAEATKAFLERDAAQLRNAGITVSKFRNAYAARNTFYEACLSLEELRAIGFTEAPQFPVPRTDFSKMQVALPPEDDADEPWSVGIVDLKVTSPNWDREDRQRQWKGKDAQDRERYFRIEDESFWTLVQADDLSTHIIDTIKVQWAYRGRIEAPKNCRVLRVLEFNGKKLAEPLSQDALSAIVSNFQTEAKDVAQADLFDGR